MTSFYPRRARAEFWIFVTVQLICVKDNYVTGFVLTGRVIVHVTCCSFAAFFWSVAAFLWGKKFKTGSEFVLMMHSLFCEKDKSSILNSKILLTNHKDASLVWSCNNVTISLDFSQSKQISTIQRQSADHWIKNQTLSTGPWEETFLTSQGPQFSVWSYMTSQRPPTVHWHLLAHEGDSSRKPTGGPGLEKKLLPLKRRPRKGPRIFFAMCKGRSTFIIIFNFLFFFSMSLMVKIH